MNYRPSTLNFINKFLAFLLVVTINVIQLATPILILAQETISPVTVEETIEPSPTPILSGDRKTDNQKKFIYAPQIIAVMITPSDPKTNVLLSAQASADDVENDNLTFKFQWKKNGINIIGETETSLDLSKKGNGDKGDQISVEVVVNDGTSDSPAYNSDPITIGNTISVASLATNE